MKKLVLSIVLILTSIASAFQTPDLVWMKELPDSFGTLNVIEKIDGSTDLIIGGDCLARVNDTGGVVWHRRAYDSDHHVDAIIQNGSYFLMAVNRVTVSEPIILKINIDGSNPEYIACDDHIDYPYGAFLTIEKRSNGNFLFGGFRGLDSGGCIVETDADGIPQKYRNGADQVVRKIFNTHDSVLCVGDDRFNPHMQILGLNENLQLIWLQNSGGSFCNDFIIDSINSRFICTDSYLSTYDFSGGYPPNYVTSESYSINNIINIFKLSVGGFIIAGDSKLIQIDENLDSLWAKEYRSLYASSYGELINFTTSTQINDSTYIVGGICDGKYVFAKIGWDNIAPIISDLMTLTTVYTGDTVSTPFVFENTGRNNIVSYEIYLSKTSSVSYAEGPSDTWVRFDSSEYDTSETFLKWCVPPCDVETVNCKVKILIYDRNGNANPEYTNIFQILDTLTVSTSPFTKNSLSKYHIQITNSYSGIRVNTGEVSLIELYNGMGRLLNNVKDSNAYFNVKTSGIYFIRINNKLTKRISIIK